MTVQGPLTQQAALPIIQCFDNDGRPLAGGMITTYLAGTTTLQATYAPGSTPSAPVYNTNPIILDACGRAQVLWNIYSAYDIVVSDWQGNQLYTIKGWAVTTSGTLSVGFVGSISALRALPAGQFSLVYVAGYYLPADGVTGTFGWNATGSRDDDGGVNIVPAGGTRPGEWQRLFTGNVDPRWFGAHGDGSDDDTAAFEAALNYISLYDNSAILNLTAGSYSLSELAGLTLTAIFEPNALIVWQQVSATLTVTAYISDGDTTRHFASAGGGPIVFANTMTVKVQWFGAKVDGTTDDTGFIQEAISAVPIGGTLLLGNGTSIVGGGDSPDTLPILIIPQAMTIQGNNSTIKLYYVPTVRTQFTIFGNSSGANVSGVVFDGFTIDGSAVNTSIGIQLLNMPNTTVQNMTFASCGIGVQCSTITGTTAETTSFFDNTFNVPNYMTSPYGVGIEFIGGIYSTYIKSGNTFNALAPIASTLCYALNVQAAAVIQGTGNIYNSCLVYADITSDDTSYTDVQIVGDQFYAPAITGQAMIQGSLIAGSLTILNNIAELGAECQFAVVTGLAACETLINNNTIICNDVTGTDICISISGNSDSGINGVINGNFLYNAGNTGTGIEEINAYSNIVYGLNIINGFTTPLSINGKNVNLAGPLNITGGATVDTLNCGTFTGTMSSSFNNLTINDTLTVDDGVDVTGGLSTDTLTVTGGASVTGGFGADSVTATNGVTATNLTADGGDLNVDINGGLGGNATIQGTATIALLNCGLLNGGYSDFSLPRLNAEFDFVITAGSCSVGATYENNGYVYTSLSEGYFSGGGKPTASGTLTKIAGTGSATISFSSVSLAYGGTLNFLRYTKVGTSVLIQGSLTCASYSGSYPYVINIPGGFQPTANFASFVCPISSGTCTITYSGTTLTLTLSAATAGTYCFTIEYESVS